MRLTGFADSKSIIRSKLMISANKTNKKKKIEEQRLYVFFAC